MTYKPENQFRCTIIRGKATRDLDNLLPSYASIIERICPCDKKEFKWKFNESLSTVINNSTLKTLDNHRTEIAGKLFGMYYEQDGLIYSSKRTEKLLENADQPAFFKDICACFQFPNGMDKIDKLKEKINKKISIRQFPYILKLLLIAEIRNISINVDNIAYYVLNSLDVLQGRIAPSVVLDRINLDKKRGINKKVSYEGKNSSFNMQHIREQLNLLVLANLILIRKKEIILNDSERENIEKISELWNEKLEFDIYKYDLELEGKKIGLDWQYYYANKTYNFQSVMIESRINDNKQHIDKNAIGDEGELYIYNYEKNRVSNFDTNLARKVLHLGKTRGLGYDVQSVIADGSEISDFVQYIEVKTTKRVTEPDFEDNDWIDTLNLTRNEWVAAEQHKSFYNIYRVYLTPNKVIVCIINNPYDKQMNKLLKVTPISYRMNLTNVSVDSFI